MDDIKNSTKEFLVPKDVSGVLKCCPYTINLQAQSDPTKLGFPVVVMGRRVRIPRIPFIAFIEV